MGFLSKFEGKMEDTVEGMAASLGGSSLSPVQITKKAEKQMRREKMVGAGVQYAPTLYTVLVSREDDERLFGYYPTLAGEVETYLMAKANELGFMMDGQPLVRFMPDDELKRGKFDVVAEMVSSPIISQLREEEMQRYGIDSPQLAGGPRRQPRQVRPVVQGPIAGASAGIAQTYNVGRPANLQPIKPVKSVKSVKSINPINPIKPAADYVVDDYVDEPKTMMFGAQQPQQEVEKDLPADESAAAYLYDEERDRAFELTGQPQRIGRESSNDIQIADINVSRVHAEIGIDSAGRWTITDLGSTNGVYINGCQVQSVPLRDGDIILLGTTELEFQLLV